MIVEKAVRTSGYAYPLRLETAILREYVLEPVPAPQVQTEKLLQEAWRRAVQAQMLAGRIDATQESLLMQGGLCILQAQSRLHGADFPHAAAGGGGLTKENPHERTNHQCRTHRADHQCVRLV